MENSKTIPAGATVYYCRRALDHRYTSLMTIETGVVKKRTPQGYKLEMRFSEVRLLDVDYYISENRKDVVDALKNDIVCAIEAVNTFLDELELAAAKL